jgi:hypothetical protein
MFPSSVRALGCWFLPGPAAHSLPCRFLRQVLGRLISAPGGAALLPEPTAGRPLLSRSLDLNSMSYHAAILR